MQEIVNNIGVLVVLGMFAAGLVAIGKCFWLWIRRTPMD